MLFEQVSILAIAFDGDETMGDKFDTVSEALAKISTTNPATMNMQLRDNDGIAMLAEPMVKPPP